MKAHCFHWVIFLLQHQIARSLVTSHNTHLSPWFCRSHICAQNRWNLFPQFSAVLMLRPSSMAPYVVVTPQPVKRHMLGWHLPGSSLDDVLTFQGRSMRIRVIRQNEQRCERNKRQIHRTASGEKFSEYWIRLRLFSTRLYTSLQKERGRQQTLLT